MNAGKEHVEAAADKITAQESNRKTFMMMMFMMNGCLRCSEINFDSYIDIIR